ncbi:MAG: hypothetical protein IKX36_01945 [Prevotella sp.]|nr:hypothetical protein [Prevotella sp.]
MRKILLFMMAVMTVGGMAYGQESYEGYSAWLQAVDEYRPAPGQFINDMPVYSSGDDAAVMASKCTSAIAGDVYLSGHGMISLGGFGGSVIFHFDHRVSNEVGQRDFCVLGNTFSTKQSDGTRLVLSSEPGIVMVSVDENGNGLPDDPWYELAGSCTDAVYDYEVTYQPNPMGDISWTDNQGGEGSILRQDEYHEQEYYPLWMEGTQTYRGTLLPKNGIQVSVSPEKWELHPFDWGYVDNQANLGANNDYDWQANGFDIDWAVDAARQPIHLDGIDFVRVYTAENQQCGWLGETSTEVMGAKDLHLSASVKAITGIRDIDFGGKDVEYYDLSGRQYNFPQRGLFIVRQKDGTVRKVAKDD